MKPYSASNTGEKETYAQYYIRKSINWEQRLRERLSEIIVEVKDSSLKEEDKERLVVDMARKILNNDLSPNNWKG